MREGTMKTIMNLINKRKIDQLRWMNKGTRSTGSLAVPLHDQEPHRSVKRLVWTHCSLKCASWVSGRWNQLSSQCFRPSPVPVRTPPLFDTNLTYYSWKQMDCQLSRPTAAHCLMNLWDPLHFLGSIPSKELRNSGKRFLIFATELRTKRDRFISRNVP